MKKLYFLIYLLIAAFALQAQDRVVPNGYYDNAAGKTGDELKEALHDIIDNHTTITYANVWGAFQSTDLKSNGKIWDMYSDIPNGTPPYEYTYGQNQCGNYDSEGDCYNREHSWPKSWFTGDENSVPGRDLHHIFPTDGYVNQQRGNNPFGEVQTATQTFQNGSKLGTCKSSLGYSGTVYEPIDAYKGDFARAYFYMSVRYYSEDSNWNSSDMTTKSELKPWALEMLLRWNEEDPVSAKEIARNEAVYGIQNNRNPFIDHPEYANMIWGDVFEGTFSQYTADIVEGDYIIVYNDHALTNTISSNKLTSTDVTPQNGVITNPSRTIVWHISKVSNTNYWTIKNEAVNKYAAGKSDKNQMELLSGVTNYAKWTPSYSNNVFEFENYGRSQLASNQYPDNKWLRCNTGSNNAWAPYNTQTGGKLTLYKYIPLEYAYSINGVLGNATQVTPGTSITLTDSEDLNDDYTFAGWTDDLSDIENNIYEAGESYQINNNVVLYAVYAHEVSGAPVTTYNKVTSAPSNWSGEYLIVCENNSVVFDGALTTLDAGNNVITNVSISNGVINPTNALNAATFTIAKVGNTSFYSIKNQNNKYIGWASTSGNGLTANNNVQSNAISLQSSGSQILIQGTNNGSTITKYLRYNTDSNSGNRFRYYNSNTDNTQNIQLYKKTTTTPTVTTYYIQVRELPEGNTEIENITTTDIITVPNGSVLTITGTSNTGTTDNLFIEDGGQLIVPNNATVAATVRKTTTASTAKGTNNWYIISSPVKNIAVESVAQGIYNMYYYNEPDNMWMNDKVGDDPSNLTVQFANLTNGRGYLYRSSVAGVEFAGNVNSSSVIVPLTRKNTNDLLKGFNLIGNPFPHDIYKNDEYKSSGDLPAINDANLTVGYYKLETDGTWVGTYGYNNPIKSGEAFLVKATSSAPADFNVTIANTNNPAASYTPSKSGFNNIMFAVTNSKYTDIAYAMFSDGSGLDKIEHYNKEAQMLYVSQDDTDYAIAMIDEKTNVISLGFKPKSIGQYSLSLKPDGNFAYLHLIDRITGEDVDMLIEDDYTFVGTPKDIENRFLVRLRFSGNAVDSNIFVYQNGSDIIVEGDGNLQIFDVLGRVIATLRVNGVETMCASSLPATGLFIFRLVGTDVKTQKIVVK